MTELGYKLIRDEHGPNDLVEYATLADRSAFEYAMISDHYHPWTSTQGESPFAWNVIGAIGAGRNIVPWTELDSGLALIEHYNGFRAVSPIVDS